MTVRNKKTGKEYRISKEDWNKIVANKQSNLFTIINKDDVPLKKMNIPNKVVEFQADARKLRIDKNNKIDTANE